MQQPVTVAPSLVPPGPIDLRVGPRPRRSRRLLAASAIVVVGAAGWLATQAPWFAPRSNVTYGLGLVGGMMMLVLLLYPLRKRLPFLQRLGALKHWFRVHMVCGICGPLFIVLHSGFQVGSVNALVALSCMILVACSGVVGRFIYRKIHHGLYGRRATQREAEDGLARELASLRPQVRDVPEVSVEIDGYAQLAARQPKGALARTFHFVALGRRRRSARQRVRHAIAKSMEDHAHDPLARERLRCLAAAADATLLALQRTGQFSAWERLFALWHVLHVPFVYMLGISAVVHVVAVHSY